MSKILTIATAGIKQGQLEDTDHTQFPRVDYLELQQHVDIKIIDYCAYEQARLGKFYRNVDTQIHSDLYLAQLGFRKSYSHKIVFAMSERVGIPLAGMHSLLKPKHKLIAMFTCWSKRQELALKTFKLFSGIDKIIVKCQSLKNHFINLGVPEEKINVILFGIDHQFFSPLPDIEPKQNFALSIGEIRSRDYPTLLKASDGLPMELLIAASGSWYAREKKKGIQADVPTNTTISGGFSRAELKQLYAKSSFIVLPIYESVYSAGATAVLEAMCMARAVIVTRSPGILDYVIDGETGILVDPGDIKGMRQAMNFLLTNPQEAKRLGKNARQRIDDELNLDNYVQQITQLLENSMAEYMSTA